MKPTILAVLIMPSCVGQSGSELPSSTPAYIELDLGLGEGVERTQLRTTSAGLVHFVSDTGFQCAETWEHLHYLEERWIRLDIIAPKPLRSGDILPTPKPLDQPWHNLLPFLEVDDPDNLNVNARRLFGGTTTIIQWNESERYVQFDGATWYRRPTQSGAESEVLPTTGPVTLRLHREGEPLGLTVLDNQLFSEAAMQNYTFADGSVPCSILPDDTHR